MIDDIVQVLRRLQLLSATSYGDIGLFDGQSSVSSVGGRPPAPLVRLLACRLLFVLQGCGKLVSGRWDQRSGGNSYGYLPLILGTFTVVLYRIWGSFTSISGILPRIPHHLRPLVGIPLCWPSSRPERIIYGSGASLPANMRLNQGFEIGKFRFSGLL